MASEQTITGQPSKLPPVESVGADAPQLLSDSSMSTVPVGTPGYPVTAQGQATIPSVQAAPQQSAQQQVPTDDGSFLGRLMDAIRVGVAPFTSQPGMFMALAERDIERKRLQRAGTQASAIQSLYLNALQSGDPQQVAEISTQLSKLKGLEPEATSALQRAQLQMADDLMKANEKRKVTFQLQQERDQMIDAIARNVATPQGKAAVDILRASPGAKITDLDNIIKLMPPQPARLELKDLPQNSKESLFQLGDTLHMTPSELIEGYNNGDHRIFQLVGNAIANPKIETPSALLTSMAEAGVQPKRFMGDFTPADYAKRAAYIERRDVQSKFALSSALMQAQQAGLGSQPVRAAAAGWYFKNSLEKVPQTISHDKFSELVSQGLVTSNLSEQQVSALGMGSVAVDTVKQLMDLIEKNEDIFPSIAKRGVAAAYAITGWNQARMKLGASTVDPVLAELKSLVAKIVPIVKTFGDAGNISDKSVVITSEGMGSAPQSRESGLTQAKSILRGLLEIPKSKGLTMQWVKDAEALLDKQPGVTSTNKLPEGFK